MARTYGDALQQLASLQSNRAITSLFTPQPQTSSSSNTKSQDLNALAIPEMLAWLGRGGLSVADLSNLNCIHVAGTKGKGSVCAYLTSILSQPSTQGVAGRVGTYTSPHLISVRERIMLDGQPISQDLFARYFFEVWDAFTSSARAEYLQQNPPDASSPGMPAEVEAAVQGPASKPFYFRFLTVMAFHVFLREGVKSAIIECGIGGEYDSTNVLPPEAVTCSVVAQLGIDHVGMLGGTLSEIAWHKIGIAKPGRKTFTRQLNGDGEEKAMAVMRERTQNIGAELVEIRDEDVEEWGGVQLDTGVLGGHYQKYNQALAAEAAKEHLRVLGVPTDTRETALRALPDGFQDGLKQGSLSGRCETRQEGHITWLIDGAHTAESLQELAKWFVSKVSSLPNSRKILLFNQQERDVARLLQALYGGLEQPKSNSSGTTIFDKAVFTTNDLNKRGDQDPERDLTVQNAAQEAYKNLFPVSQTIILDNVSNAVAEIRGYNTLDGSGQETVVLVTGSLYLVGAVLRILEPEAPL
ncbi:Mur ligase [Xylariales sp. PMI_506]|nr:Mur ligase [Xylariales sp. PMI_506]